MARWWHDIMWLEKIIWRCDRPPTCGVQSHLLTCGDNRLYLVKLFCFWQPFYEPKIFTASEDLEHSTVSNNTSAWVFGESKNKSCRWWCHMCSITEILSNRKGLKCSLYILVHAGLIPFHIYQVKMLSYPRLDYILIHQAESFLTHHLRG